MHLQPHVRAWAVASRASLQRISSGLSHMGSKLFAIGSIVEVAEAEGAMLQQAREEVRS
jgi:hypothetical protein